MKKKWMILFAVLPVLFFSGCWDSTVDDEADEDIPKNDVLMSERITASADSVLSSMMGSVSEGSSITDFTDYIATASDLYREAAEADPANSHANFGAGVFSFQGILDHPDINMIQDKLREWSQNIDNLDNARYHITRYFMYGQSWVLVPSYYGENTWMEYIEIDPGTAFMAMVYFVQNSMTEPDLIALFQDIIDTTIIPVLDDTIGYMNNVLTDDTFTFSITPEMSGEDITMELDLGEAYMLTALMYVFRANVKIINAYQLSLPGADSMGDYFDGTSLINLIKSQDEQGGDFLTLRSTAILPSARQDLLDALTLVEQGVAFIKQETDDQMNDLIKREDVMEADAEIGYNIGTDIPVSVIGTVTGIGDITFGIKTMLSGPFDIETPDANITVNLSAFLNNGIPDLKAVLPYHKWVDFEQLLKILEGPGIKWSYPTEFAGETMQRYYPFLLDVYSFITQDNTPLFYDVYGHVSDEGVLTVLAGDVDGNIVELEAGAQLTSDGAFYLDSANRVCITEQAYQIINDYIKNAPRESWEAIGMLDLAAQFINLNFSTDHPYGVRGSDGVFKFSGSFRYISYDDEIVYLVDEQGNRIDQDNPVFPDPTFGGLFPGMTQELFAQLQEMD